MIVTRVLAPLSAIVMAGVLNFIGATQISGVAQTISTGLVNAEDTTQIVVLCAVSGAIFWNLLTWYYGIPSSSSYALIGGLIGAAWAHLGLHTIIWKGVLGKGDHPDDPLPSHWISGGSCDHENNSSLGIEKSNN